MNEDLRFKIIKDQPEEKKHPPFQEEIKKKPEKSPPPPTNIFNYQQQIPSKRFPKFFLVGIISLIIILIIIITIYFVFLRNNKKQKVAQVQEAQQDIFQIFFNTQTPQIIPSEITTPTVSQPTSSESFQTTSANQLASNIISTSSSPTTNISTTSEDQIFFITPNQNVLSQPTQTTSSIATSSKPTTPPTRSATTTTSSLPELSSEPPSPTKNQFLETKINEITNQYSNLGLSYLNFPSLELEVKELNDEGFQKSWLSLIKIQKRASEIYDIKFLYQNQSISSEFIKNYFLRPSFIEKKYVDSFLQSLGDYQILFYYTHTRKFPILIFRIKDDLQVVPFMRLWDKESLIKDLQETIFVGLPKGNLIRNFTITETYEGIDYKIAYFDNNYKLIWTMYKNYLIISTSLSAFKYILKNM